MDVHYMILTLKLAIALLGATIVYLAYRGYRRHKSLSMLLLSVGFSLITIGTVMAGVLFEFMGFSLLEVYEVESVFSASGLLTILYAIYSVRS